VTGTVEVVPMSAELASLAEKINCLGLGRDIPGLAIGVYSDGAEHYLGHGVRSAERDGPVGPHTQFRVGSLSKVFTATMLMRLAEGYRRRALVDLDRPVADYLPDFALRDTDTARSVTARHLATHRGGWVSNAFERRSSRELDDAALKRAVAELADAEQISPLGRFYSYSNSGFAVLGRLIESVTRTTFEDAANGLLLHPMSLRRTCFPVAADIPAAAADGHTGTPPAVVRPWSRSRARSPAGGLVSTASDLVAFARCLLDGGAPVLHRETVAAMWAPQAEAVGFAERIGLGWNLNRLDDGTWYVCHGGNADGYAAMLSVMPVHRFAVAVLVNSPATPVVDRVQDWVTQRFLGRVRYRAVSPPVRAAAHARDYVGRYTDGIADVSVTTTETGVLLAPADPGSRLPAAEVRFTGDEEGIADVGGSELIVRFLRHAGEVRWLRIAGLVFRREAGL
jgi:CubicO group peptidase (beta-lactamase class C family)